ncbi:rRNA maturation RNase YbeY [Metabacillus fastidiosus]|uniref:Endoribonuclease YbeY n=1 Tax=Metabacillus fastidiosus TaxID=1458 RepID=A0ABU6NYL2_9BACI|nr:rRNA maturation RNase YbeY [Metabacillus fastidiosus]MEC2076519.1 rRNA maturation RNase YbeY [Metabacillus fastidiosus]MED4400976.1 rRNA maturation RNase YbeY [Metabacillus fastidiosus]MED4453446.1 rRNA maturation RNase YbeY [Metabacillus fastidiosus]MED4463902.1 rRNA maturation RNase YbeY [Metabacillus fastidiosus]MED4530760.1 rRNA maturation RNase YbeY [Metabacillus fastidiosus]
MRLDIDLIDETEELTEEEISKVEELLQFAAEMEAVEQDTELSVTFVSNERIQEINKEYRDKDQPTDVISFALEEMGEGELEIIGLDMPTVLGDIIISIPRAREQADEYGHTFLRELGFLAVHGFLHLLGYDHMNEEDEKKMFNKQKEILEQYGLKRSAE